MAFQPIDIRIRRYAPRDLPKVRALNARIGPYRPEDQEVVEAMVARAAAAERAGDRWVPLDSAPDSLDTIDTSYLAFWVAVTPERQGDDVVGMIGVRRFGFDTEESGGLALAAEWQRRGDVAELRRLRVAPEVWRRGIGARLTQTVIDWSRENGFRSLVLNTTSPQAAARALYRRLGFTEVARSYIGSYELVWLEIHL
jgi:GNAT superfamily N-acetyltransferase